ncbi:hypothetical protein MKW98_019796 [Papaver atlanticum]|uniref:PGG domain-containing protein n=1 Tax=Papaver atlanticum TaxID=357466 RepID=A0AAD4TCR9_9MAGN|nr:hypothetical protein MKW98_019796 [Papaver atlanticum]
MNTPITVSTNTSSTVGDDHRLHETIMLSTKLIVESQEAMLRKIEACNEASTASIATLLCKVVESQDQNQQQQAHNKHKMMEMFKIFANNNSMNINVGISNEVSAGNSPIDNPNVQNWPSIPTVGGDIEGGVENGSSEGDVFEEEKVQIESSEGDDIEEEVEIESPEHSEVDSSEINGEREEVMLQKKRQKEVNQVNQEEEDKYNYYDGYEPLIEAVYARDWRKAIEYLHEHQTVLKEIFRTRDLGKELFIIFWEIGAWGQYTLLGELLKLVPPQTLEFVNPNGGTILHLVAKDGDLTFAKALVEKNLRLTQIRSNDHWQCVPLFTAALSTSGGQKEMVRYLCSVTRDEDPSPFSGEQGVALLANLISADMYGLALSVCQRFPSLVEELMDDEANGNTVLLQNIVERPFAFLSGAKLKWWERYIYELIEVDMNCPCDGGVDRGKEKESTTKEDEENPPDASSSEVSSPSEQCSSTDNKRSITKYISLYLMRYIGRGDVVRRLYDQKLMHEQVVVLTQYLLEQLDRKTEDKQIIKDIFLKSNMLEMAMKFETTEFVLKCLQVFRFLCLDDDKGEVGHTLIKLVASERNEMIYNFMLLIKSHYLADKISKLDENNNSILHYSAELAHNRRLNAISGAAFQMQREIQWFKGVESTMLQKDRYIRNKNGDTAQFLFTEKHKDLMEKGEKWMKDLSTSCMVVAALIATVSFAAAFTVPGGNIQENTSSDMGLPVFLKKNSFMVFATADALALFSSISSVLMFLAVFTSRYSEEDFLKALPQKLMLGLATLFISMASILVSFEAAFSIILGKRFLWALITVSLFGCAPVLLFGFLQFPLLVEMVSSTYWPINLGKLDYRIYLPYFREDERKYFLKIINNEV